MEPSIKLLFLFRWIAIAEGISFLVLLFIAMPLKYLAHRPLAVQYVGWGHGVLFMLFLTLALMVSMHIKKRFLWLVKAFFASIIPFGTLVLERQMKKDGDFNSLNNKKYSGDDNPIL